MIVFKFILLGVGILMAAIAGLIMTIVASDLMAGIQGSELEAPMRERGRVQQQREFRSAHMGFKAMGYHPLNLALAREIARQPNLPIRLAGKARAMRRLYLVFIAGCIMVVGGIAAPIGSGHG